MRLNSDTIVTISGRGDDLHNGKVINGGKYTIQSVGIQNTPSYGKTTVMLVNGNFEDDEILT